VAVSRFDFTASFIDKRFFFSVGKMTAPGKHLIFTVSSPHRREKSKAVESCGNTDTVDAQNLKSTNKHCKICPTGNQPKDFRLWFSGDFRLKTAIFLFVHLKIM
jgi:hypothetical protein